MEEEKYMRRCIELAKNGLCNVPPNPMVGAVIVCNGRIIGEVRGKEALDLLQSLNTGHDGGFSSGHANSVKDMLSRLETMVLMAADLPLAAIRSQIASAVDIMVHVSRMRDKTRKVTAIEEVDRFENGEIILNPLFTFREAEKAGDGFGNTGKVEGSLEQIGTLKHREKLRLAGYRV